MYTEIGKISDETIFALQEILDGVRWEEHVSGTTDHQAAPCGKKLQSVDEIVSHWPIDTWARPIFLRLPAGGKLYRHADTGFGFHIPIETNDDCVSLSYENGLRKEQHLDVGKIYKVDRSIEHESFNYGNTDRTHLIILLKESDNEQT